MRSERREEGLIKIPKGRGFFSRTGGLESGTKRRGGRAARKRGAKTLSK